MDPKIVLRQLFSPFQILLNNFDLLMSDQIFPVGVGGGYGGGGGGGGGGVHLKTIPSYC